MELNLSKNELVTFFEDTPDPFPRDVKDADGVIISRGVDRFFRNFELLGSPIGDADFCSSFVKSFTKKAVVHTLGPLSSLDDPQVAHMLLQLCASFCRVVHLLRGVPIIFCTEAMQEFDAAVRKAFSVGVGLQFSDTA